MILPTAVIFGCFLFLGFKGIILGLRWSQIKATTSRRYAIQLKTYMTKMVLYPVPWLEKAPEPIDSGAITLYEGYLGMGNSPPFDLESEPIKMSSVNYSKQAKVRSGLTWIAWRPNKCFYMYWSYCLSSPQSSVPLPGESHPKRHWLRQDLWSRRYVALDDAEGFDRRTRERTRPHVRLSPCRIEMQCGKTARLDCWIVSTNWNLRAVPASMCSPFVLLCRDEGRQNGEGGCWI